MASKHTKNLKVPIRKGIEVSIDTSLNDLNFILPDSLLRALKLEVKNYVGGKLHHHISEWESITTDPFLINTIKYGLHLEFKSMPRTGNPVEHPISSKEQKIVDLEVEKLLKKGVIVPTQFGKGDFCSGVFTRPKKYGTRRMILNLKNLNEHMEYNHFKMESIHNVIHVIRPGVYMASVDLKDAFYSIKITKANQKYLKFCNKGQYFEFTCMPNGYGPAMRVFTKTTKPVFATLRGKGYISVCFVDDTFLQGDNYEECLKNVNVAIELLRQLGFTVHLEKSVLTPRQEIIFLGFILNSTTMTIRITPEKKRDIYNLCSLILLDSSKVTIRQVACLIGKIVASFPGVAHGELYYRAIELDKIDSLRINKGQFDKMCKLNLDAINEINWWKNNIFSCYKEIHLPEIDLVLHTDASNTGWGITNGYISSGGQWDIQEQNFHINVLELKAIFMGMTIITITNM